MIFYKMHNKMHNKFKLFNDFRKRLFCKDHCLLTSRKYNFPVSKLVVL